MSLDCPHPEGFHKSVKHKVKVKYGTIRLIDCVVGKGNLEIMSGQCTRRRIRMWEKCYRKIAT